MGAHGCRLQVSCAFTLFYFIRYNLQASPSEMSRPRYCNTCRARIAIHPLILDRRYPGGVRPRHGPCPAHSARSFLCRAPQSSPLLTERREGHERVHAPPLADSAVVPFLVHASPTPCRHWSSLQREILLVTSRPSRVRGRFRSKRIALVNMYLLTEIRIV